MRRHKNAPTMLHKGLSESCDNFESTQPASRKVVSFKSREFVARGNVPGDHVWIATTRPCQARFTSGLRTMLQVRPLNEIGLRESKEKRMATDAENGGQHANMAATKKQRWTWAMQILVVLMLLWLLLNGTDRFLAGLLAASAGAGLGAWLVSGQPHPWKPHRLLWFAGFFLWESLKGGVDVAWRAIHPKLRIEPCFSTHRIELPAGQPRTLMVATVSLLPGTLSADLDEAGRDLEVHALMPEAIESVERLENWVAWLFSIDS